MFDWIKKITKYAELALAFGVMSILLVLLLPVPSVLLDVLLALSISISVLILMNTLFISKPLELSVFPTLLLVTTLLRLSLNIASTRLILSEGHNGSNAAGRVIEAFGHFVMQGNVIIGIIVFMILTIINFIVITKGSGRIAEVAARFSLDSMPGKQMAIDADLSNGLINDSDAKARRREIEDESTFYGAMDGANKFVRGDAIAGIIITFINLIGGIIIGVVQRGLSFGKAIDTYAILTIGDGLVSQIPSLIISLAAGLLVTKSGVVGSIDKAIFGQLGKYYQTLLMSSIITGLMSFLPGLPFFPFFILSICAGFVSYLIHKSNTFDGKKHKSNELRRSSVDDGDARGNPNQSNDASELLQDSLSDALSIDQIRIELGFGLLSLITSSSSKSNLSEQVKNLRSQLAKEYGFVMPPVRIKDNAYLSDNNYHIKIKEIDAGSGSVMPNSLLIINPNGGEFEIEGTDTKDPAFGLNARWIDDEKRQDAMIKNYTVVEASTVIITHLSEAIKENIKELLSYTETQKLLDNLTDEYKKLVKDLIPDVVDVSTVQRILQNLLSEHISIRDLPTILEGIAESAKTMKNVVEITESVRTKLSRHISYIHSDSDGTINILVLSQFWDQTFSKSISGNAENSYLSMQPSLIQQFITELKSKYDEIAEKNSVVPVIVTTPLIRPHVRSVVAKFKSNVSVLSHREISDKFKIKTLGML